MGEATGSGTSDVSKKHKLRIIFDGVIAVGPPAPADGGTRQGPYFGVMARSTRRISERSRRLKENPPTFIPMHVPTIYTTMTPEKGSRPPDEIFRLTTLDPEWFIWHPVRERLELRIDGSGTPGPLTYDRASRFTEHGGGGMHSGVKLHKIKMVPDARGIWPERAELIEGLMSAETPVREEAQAQVLVPWGDVLGSGVFDKKDGVDVKFDPPRAASGTYKVVPNVAVIVEAERVEIAMFSLDTGDHLDPIKFNLSEDAELWISNGDPSDTAIDLQKLTADRVGRNDDIQEAAATFRRKHGGDFLVSEESTLVDQLALGFIIGGGGLLDPAVLNDQHTRRSPVDIDFELFYTILRRKDLERDNLGLPVPIKADGKDFEGPNCLVQQVECVDRLFFKSGP